MAFMVESSPEVLAPNSECDSEEDLSPEYNPVTYFDKVYNSKRNLLSSFYDEAQEETVEKKKVRMSHGDTG